MKCKECLFLEYHYKYSDENMGFYIEGRTCRLLRPYRFVNNSDDIECKFPISLWLMLLIINFNRDNKKG